MFLVCLVSKHVLNGTSADPNSEFTSSFRSDDRYSEKIFILRFGSLLVNLHPVPTLALRLGKPVNIGICRVEIWIGAGCQGNRDVPFEPAQKDLFTF